MKLLGFYIGGHDSNVSLSDSNGKVRYFKLERIIQSKHKKGSLDWIKKICEENQFYPDYVCFSDGNRNGFGICDVGELWQECVPFSIFPSAKTYCIDHHYAHILSAFPVVNKKIDFGVCVDGRGDYQAKCSVIENPFNINKCKMVFSSKEDAYCLMFNKIGELMHLSGGELDYAGKIMGAHAYGNVDNEYIMLLDEYAREHGVTNTLNMDYKGVKIEILCKKKNKDFYDWLASYHSWIGRCIYNLIKKNVKENSSLVYSGGGAQNTVYNSFLSNYFNMSIPPHCYDGGLSLGCIKFLGETLGIDLLVEEFPFCHDDDNLGYASESTINQVVDLLASGKIVGWCQGRSEIGPRALGHRSILMDPSLADAKRVINQRVKKREEWRPFAASVLKQDIEQICGKPMELDYMLHAVPVLQEFRMNLRSVVHIDGTCRFQTVDDTEELHSYYRLIELFKMKTGVYGILNTSYNLSGKPIASSRDDVLTAFNLLDLDALCIGDKLIIRKR